MTRRTPADHVRRGAKQRLARRKDPSGADEWLQVIGFQDVTVLDILSVGFNFPLVFAKRQSDAHSKGTEALLKKLMGLIDFSKSRFRIIKVACQKFP